MSIDLIVYSNLSEMLCYQKSNRGRQRTQIKIIHRPEKDFDNNFTTLIMNITIQSINHSNIVS